MDVAYIVRPGEFHEELRYSMRSLRHVLNFDPDRDRVWIIGTKPDWCVGVEHVDINPYPDSKGHAIHQKWAAACEAIPGQRFISMDDDVFVMRPFIAIGGEVRGTLADMHDKFGKRLGWWGDAVRATWDYCQTLAFTPLSYDLHRPVVFNREKFAVSLAESWNPIREPPLVKTVYGNRWGIFPTLRTDYKAKKPREDVVPTGKDILSTTEQSFHYSAVGAYICASFPEPSRYERA